MSTLAIHHCTFKCPSCHGACRQQPDRVAQFCQLLLLQGVPHDTGPWALLPHRKQVPHVADQGGRGRPAHQWPVTAFGQQEATCLPPHLCTVTFQGSTVP